MCMITQIGTAVSCLGNKRERLAARFVLQGNVQEGSNMQSTPSSFCGLLARIVLPNVSELGQMCTSCFV